MNGTMRMEMLSLFLQENRHVTFRPRSHHLKTLIWTSLYEFTTHLLPQSVRLSNTCSHSGELTCTLHISKDACVSFTQHWCERIWKEDLGSTFTNVTCKAAQSYYLWKVTVKQHSTVTVLRFWRKVAQRHRYKDLWRTVQSDHSWLSNRQWVNI